MFDDDVKEVIKVSVIEKDKSKVMLGWTRSEDSAETFINNSAYGMIKKHHKIVLAERIKFGINKPIKVMMFRRRKNGKLKKIEIGGYFDKRNNNS